MKRKAHSCDGSSVCFLLIALSLLVVPISPAAEEQGRLKWRDCLRQKPEWYGTRAALRVAENVLLYQRETGGWPKNIDMAAPISEREQAQLFRQRKQESTIDNGATYSQMIFLARVYSATRQGRFREAFVRALDALLEAQYGNGGWPQVFPNATGYARHITFNDDAMIGVMTLLRDVARGERDYRFVDAKRRAKAARAVEKGVKCILNCQIVVFGEKTVWCAQHDEETLRPAPARIYEKVSLSGSESVGIVRFLMGIERPGPQVVAAVQAAVAWFDRVKLIGIRQVNRPDSSLPTGYDRVIVADPTAPPLWARFYEIGTNRPIFCGRDGVVKYSLAEIEHERRVGYAWYTQRPAPLLKEEYCAWQRRWAPEKNVLAE